MIVENNPALLNPQNSTSDDPEASGNDDKVPSTEPETTSIKSMLCRVYLVAFCVYAHAYNLVYYNILSVVPFFLKKVIKADPLVISYLNVSLTALIAVCTLIMSFIFQTLDKILSWLTCRMIFAVVPMILQMVFLVGLSKIHTITTGIFILSLSAIAGSTLFSGSIYTINYEIDPENSPLLISVFNSCGQIAGFIGPIMMAAITTTDPEILDYDSVYRQRWAYFFYAVAGIAASGFLAIVLAYLIKPDEWVNRAKKA